MTYSIPISLIYKANDEKWLRSLAYWVKMKGLYKNCTHYKFTLRSLADKMDCSYTQLRKHLVILRRVGLVVDHCGNITFVSKKKIDFELYDEKTFGRFKVINVSPNIKKQLLYIQNELIKFNIEHQQHWIKKQKTENNVTLGGNLVPYSNKERFRESSYAGLSSWGFGNVLNVSKSTGSRLRKEMADEKLFKRREMVSYIYTGVSYQFFCLLRANGSIPPYSYFKNNKIIVRLRDKIVYPIIGGASKQSNDQKRNNI